MQYSPKTAALIEQIRVQTNDQLGFYAAFIIVCLEARVQKEGLRALQNLRLSDLRSYTFFEHGNINDDEHILFMNALETYCLDCRQRDVLFSAVG
jgi:hypothetical protein